jgi:hypothetical protein
MKRLLVSMLLGSVTLTLGGVMAGCSASASVDPHDSGVHARTAGDRDETYTKKTIVRDANGNVVERKVEEKHTD